MPIWIWLVAAGVLGAAELLTGTFYMLVLAAASLFGAAAGALGCGLELQVLAAAAAAVLGCALVWKFHRKAAASEPAQSSLDEGQSVEVRAWRGDGTAEVKYRGAVWTAVAAPGSRLVPGIWVIVRTEGPRLLISPGPRSGAGPA